jgi:UDP-GlcNAc:undecaprenyl-phosphate GlcNAc-1-phosphate transferase
VALTEVSSQLAILIVCVVVAAVLFGAKKIGIFHMNDSAHQH